MVKHIHVPIPNQRSESATSHVIKEGAVRTALTVHKLSSTNSHVGPSTRDYAAFSGFLGTHVAACLLQISWKWPK